jgi:dsRNA-specific ribonuclease
MDQDVTTRVALAAKGREIGLHRYILFSPDSLKASSNHVAETFEAIIGAVYLDSGKQLSNVTRMLKNMGLDKHPLLRETSERRGQLVRRVASTADKDLRK